MEKKKIKKFKKVIEEGWDAEDIFFLILFIIADIFSIIGTIIFSPFLVFGVLFFTFIVTLGICYVADNPREVYWVEKK